MRIVPHQIMDTNSTVLPFIPVTSTDEVPPLPQLSLVIYNNTENIENNNLALVSQNDKVTTLDTHLPMINEDTRTDNTDRSRSSIQVPTNNAMTASILPENLKEHQNDDQTTEKERRRWTKYSSTLPIQPQSNHYNMSNIPTRK